MITSKEMYCYMRKVLFVVLFFSTIGGWAQPPKSAEIDFLGTRNWIRLNWKTDPNGHIGYKIYWSEESKRPLEPNITLKGNLNRYYIEKLKPETIYYVWLDGYNESGTIKIWTGKCKTVKEWVLDKKEMQELTVNPSSSAVPKGMQIFWQDEFNDQLLNRNKWSTNYYSNIDHLRGEFEKDMRSDSLPQPAFKLNGKTIDLFTSDSLPEKVYDKKNGKKISSIQTYDWRTNENLLDNSRGGYFEVKVKRSSTGNPQGLNTAFWFDAAGPDLRNYLERGTLLNGVEGVRPKGQVFEIDVFEYLNAQFVLHGHVDAQGRFQRNLATHIADGYTHVNNWVTHGILWTPTSIKHYINGNLIKEYTDKHQVFSPNHFMNVLLGSYGGGGTVNMEVDYIRGYQWPLNNGNELPNPGFEENDDLSPWKGKGRLLANAGKNGSNGVVLKPGEAIEQYVYLNNNEYHDLQFFLKGNGTVTARLDNVKLVTGELDQVFEKRENGNVNFLKKTINFKTGKEHSDYMKTIRLRFINESNAEVVLDDITIKK